MLALPSCQVRGASSPMRSRGAVQAVHHAAVRDERDRLARMRARRCARRCRRSAHRSRAASRRRPGRSPGRAGASAATPRASAASISAKVWPSKRAEAALAQAGVGRDRHAGDAADGLRRLVRARQVARVDRGERLVGERLRQPLGLPAPVSLSGTSSWPWMRVSTFQAVSPWRIARMRVGSAWPACDGSSGEPAVQRVGARVRGLGQHVAGRSPRAPARR